MLRQRDMDLTPAPADTSKELMKRAFLYAALVLGGMGSGAFLLAFVLAGEIYDYQDSVDGVHLPAVDAIVCLAGGRGRISAAGDIWYRYWEQAQHSNEHPPMLYLSGLGHQANWGVFAKRLRAGVLQVIHPEDVVLETESVNTDANARYLERYASQHHWRKILLITSSYHMKRARFIFERVLKHSPEPVGIETLSFFQEPFEPIDWKGGLYGIRVTMFEYFKWVYYRYFWPG